MGMGTIKEIQCSRQKSTERHMDSQRLTPHDEELKRLSWMGTPELRMEVDTSPQP